MSHPADHALLQALSDGALKAASNARPGLSDGEWLGAGAKNSTPFMLRNRGRLWTAGSERDQLPLRC